MKNLVKKEKEKYKKARLEQKEKRKTFNLLSSI